MQNASKKKDLLICKDEIGGKYNSFMIQLDEDPFNTQISSEILLLNQKLSLLLNIKIFLVYMKKKVLSYTIKLIFCNKLFLRKKC